MSLLILDIGSSSVRALLLNEQLVTELTTSESYSFTSTPPGAAIVDARDLQALVERCMDQVMRHPSAKDIQVVGIDTFVGNVLGVDSGGQPLTPVYTYADTRSIDDVTLLKHQMDVGAVHQRTGCIPHTAYQPGKLHWLRRTQPEIAARAGHWVDFATYLYQQWFGKSVCSYSVAAWSGMLDFTTMDWDQGWLDLLKIDRNRFPGLADYDQMQSGLKPEYARRWPSLRDVPFCLAVGDGAAANIGSGCVDESRIALTVGTTAALRVISSGSLPTVPEGLWRYCVDSRRYLTGGATSEGGNVFAWARETLNLPDAAQCEAELSTREPDSHGLTFLPLLSGERSPGWRAHATGSLVGMRLSTTPLDILQAALEGVALRLALIAEQLQKVAAEDAVVIGSGGALTASPVWGQMIANALNRPLLMTSEKEITARGAAVLALAAIGQKHEVSMLDARLISPQPHAVPIMRAALKRQRELYQKTVIR